MTKIKLAENVALNGLCFYPDFSFWGVMTYSPWLYNGTGSIMAWSYERERLVSVNFLVKENCFEAIGRPLTFPPYHFMVTFPYRFDAYFELRTEFSEAEKREIEGLAKRFKVEEDEPLQRLFNLPYKTKFHDPLNSGGLSGMQYQY